MNTYIYMIRHGESLKSTKGSERTRGLTEKGNIDASRVTELLINEGIHTFISSPYSRAILTLSELAEKCGKEIMIYEDLKECIFLDNDRIISDKELSPLVKKVFSDPDYSLPGGESMKNCQSRSVLVIKELLIKFKGHKIAIGTHGLVMTLMIEFFDSEYGYDFLMKTSKPDIYRLEFNEYDLLTDVKRLWSA